MSTAGDGVSVKRLVEAVRTGDVQLVRDMLEARPGLINTDLAENNEHRAIHYAVLDRSVELVRLLMACGADAQQGIHPRGEPAEWRRRRRQRRSSAIFACICAASGALGIA